MSDRFGHKLDPDLVLRPGTSDARLILGLWGVRKTFYPLLWLGLSVAVVAYSDLSQIEEAINFEDPTDLLSNLLSPLGFLVTALVLRIVVNWTALAAAFPLTGWTHEHEYQSRYEWINVMSSWWDRLYLARAYRALRWSRVVRESAYQRLGPEGRAYRLFELTVFWAGIVLLVVMFAVLVVSADKFESN